MTIGVEESTSSRLAVPGVARDARLRTIVSAELPFFNDPAMTARLISAGIEPQLAAIPRRCRVADFGGADGFVAQAVVDYLARHEIQAHAIVVDANPRSLELAQRRGLAVVPCNLEQVKVAAVHVIVMRLVLQYNDADAQRRILARAFECLAPGGFLLLQAEAGASASVLFRNRLVRALQNAMDEPPARQCRWVSTPGLKNFVSRRGFELVLADPEFLVFEMPLDEMLLLAWTRFHGAPVTDGARSRFASFCDYAQSLAGRMLARPGASGLRVGADGTKYFASRQTLIVARKSTGEGR